MRRKRDGDDEEKPKTRHDDTIEIPYDPVGEQVIIAAALVDSEARASLCGKLRAEQFSVPEHSLAWTHVILPMHKGKMEYDPATVQQLSAGKVDVAYLTDLVEARPEAPPNLSYHVEQLFWDSARMAAVKGPLASLLAGLRDPHTKPERIKALSSQLTTTFATHAERSYLLDSRSLARTQIAEIDQRIAGHAVYPYGIPGIDDYESGHAKDGDPRFIPGSKPGLTTVVTAISGHGKSTFTARVALAQARGLVVNGVRVRKRKKVLYGAWEMSGGMTLELLACMALNYSRTAVMSGRLTKEERDKLHATMEAIGQYVTFMVNPFMVERKNNRGKRPSTAHHLDIIEKHISDSGCDVFIGDLWARCLLTDDPGEEAEALWCQQEMHERLQVHGILLQQQNIEKLTSRRDKWPTQETVHGSKAWTHIADNMIGLNLPSMWKNLPPNLMEVHVLKQRYGPFPLLVECEWDGDRGHIGAGVSQPYPRADSGMGEGGSNSAFEAPKRRGRSSRD